MIFPSLFIHLESGIASQISVFVVLALSFMINRAKKVFIISFLLIASLFSIRMAYSFSYVPGGCGTLCMANQNYYGPSFGNSPVYYYPQMPFHTLYGPTPYYFRPYPPSPYQPTNCVACMMRYQQFTQPFPGMQGNMGITYLQIPFKMGFKKSHDFSTN